MHRWDWFAAISVILVAIGAGMAIMYWLVDWGTHGYVCLSDEKKVICSKEI